MADKEREDLDNWLDQFRRVGQHPSTGQRTEDIKDPLKKWMDNPEFREALTRPNPERIKE